MTPKAVVQAFHLAFVSRNVDALMALYADDAVNHQVADEPFRGKDAIRRSFEEFFRAFPGETTEVLNLFEDGEWGIWEWRGGHQSAASDAPVVHGCGFFQIRDGKIAFQRGYWDKLTFLRAHGLPLPTR
jgi:steroid delta-isomerase-like uncharacterized protein